MKIVITISIIFAFGIVSAQNQWSKEGKAFDSYFQKTESGRFKGSVTGILLLTTRDGAESSYAFSNKAAYLNLIPDINENYDVSFKNYTV